MDCPECRHQNPPDAVFCNSCGQRLKVECPECGKLNPPGSRFCNKCGKGLSMLVPAEEMQSKPHSLQDTSSALESVSLAEGERYQATVLFSDLTGYTLMNERLDPEEVEAIMSRIKMGAAKIVEGHEGIVNQFVGDEVLALFGIPKVHEDDPVRAVKVALDIHQLVRKISPEVEKEIDTLLRMHTGISTGLVVTHISDSREGRYGITGDAVNLGARLAAQAETDEILIDPDTHRLVAPYFKTKKFAPISVRGKAKPITPYGVLDQLAVQTRFEAAEKRGFTAFTGRGRELARLNSCLEKALIGNGQFVTIVGEAGLGKSRLIYEFRHSLNRSKISVLQGRCQSYGSRIPYFPLINALRRGLNLRDEDTPSELHEKAIANVLAIDPSLEQYLPLYLHLLSIQSETYPFPKHLHGQELTNEIKKAFAAINILNSRKKPYVIVLEDWHWADEASDSAIKHIISVIASHPVMVLVIFRPEYASNWGNWSHHTPITLSPLDNQNCSNIIKSVWGVEHLPEGIPSLIYQRTGGNPFFVEEISSALKEEGKVQLKNQKAVLTQSIEDLSLPDTVQSVIRARLDRLDRFSRESLRLASVIGREFAQRILERISASKGRLDRSLENLKVMELIKQIRVMPEAEYMFNHVITQEVTYETLLLQKRKELHGLVGLAMEELYQDRIEEQVNLLYRHFSLAENWRKAAEYGRRAADKAYRLGEFQEAVITFDNTYNCLTRLTESRSRQEHIVDLQVEMVWPLHFLGQQDRALMICKQAETIANALNDPVRICKVHHQFGISYFFTNQYYLAEGHFLKILRHPRNRDLADRIQSVKFSLAANYMSIGHWQEAADLYTEVISDLEANGNQSIYFDDTPFLPYTHMCHHLGHIRALQGSVNEAKKLIQKSYTPALDRISNLQSRAYCSLWHSTVSALIGEDYGALARVNAVLEIAEETDSPILRYLGLAAKSNALIAANRFEAAREVLKDSLQCIEGTTHRRYLEAVYFNLVSVSLELGYLDEAHRYYREAIPLVKSNPEREAARFNFLKGRLLASADPPDYANALDYYEKSIQADEASGAVVPAAQTRFYLAQMLLQSGDTERSRSIFENIKDNFGKWSIPCWRDKCARQLRLFD